MINLEELDQDLQLIKSKSPLIHNITNFVVMNNTANALLAIGASPVMAHAREEVQDMVQFASALVLNIGTLDGHWLQTMIFAGNKANELNIPIILDPVGAGATTFRTNACKLIIKECSPSIIRGNASEIMSLWDADVKTKGVDSNDSSDTALAFAKELANQTHAIVSISGATDYVTDGTTVNTVKNGSPMMTRVTGMGCTATAITGAFAGVNNNYLQAATHAMQVMGIAGELAAAESRGTGSFQINFLDQLSNLSIETIRKHINP